MVAERVRDWPFVTAGRKALVRPVTDQRDMSHTQGKGLDICVSTELQNRALRVAEALLKALERRGHTLNKDEHHAEVIVLGDAQRLRLLNHQYDQPMPTQPSNWLLRPRMNGVIGPAGHLLIGQL